MAVLCTCPIYEFRYYDGRLAPCSGNVCGEHKPKPKPKPNADKAA